MFCPKCGQDVVDGSQMCPTCGQSLVATSDSAPVMDAVQPTVSPSPEVNEPAQVMANETETMVSPTAKGGIGWAILGFFIPIVGLILFFIWKKDKPGDAKMAGIGALISVILGIVLVVISLAIGATTLMGAIENGDLGEMTVIENGEGFVVETDELFNEL